MSSAPNPIRPALTGSIFTGPVFIGLGANIPSPAGPPARTFRAALQALARAGLEITAVSPFYETEAWPDPGDPRFLNAVAALRTRLQPFALMTLLHQVETAFGRTRSRANAPRSLDLDLLDYDGEVHSGALTLPHPRLAERRFVLEPLRDIAPDWRHPVSGRDVAALLAAVA
ncbi:MAG TPA: 2-amino-4-hydroxy-6-hydroxymethyldihydropteridine diphosphokinase [Rhizomicrobium sp.]|nr:2-amino-4-hydroxy-6-hydroxymethyldihydropteridine diphosphokinase [Rhizomicrobium sp.]